MWIARALLRLALRAALAVVPPALLVTGALSPASALAAACASNLGVALLAHTGL